MFCVKCGKNISNESKFCSFCGNRVDSKMYQRQVLIDEQKKAEQKASEESVTEKILNCFLLIVILIAGLLVIGFVLNVIISFI